MAPAILFIKKNKKVILIVIGLVLLAFAIKYIVKKIKEKKQKNFPNTNPLVGGTIPENWTPNTLAERFESKFIGISGDVEAKNEVLEDIYNLNQNQLIELVNYWNENYRYKTSFFVEYGTIYEIIEGEWGPIATTGDTVNYFTLVKEKLIEYNLV